MMAVIVFGMSLRIRKISILAFVIFHAASVAVFAIPSNVHHPSLRTLRAALYPILSPYIYLTSQWQDWRMFVGRDPFVYTERRAVSLVSGQRLVRSRFLSSEEQRLLVHAPQVESLRTEICQSAPPDARMRIEHRLYFRRTGEKVTDAELQHADAISAAMTDSFVRIESELPCPAI